MEEVDCLIKHYQNPWQKSSGYPRSVGTHHDHHLREWGKAPDCRPTLRYCLHLPALPLLPALTLLLFLRNKKPVEFLLVTEGCSRVGVCLVGDDMLVLVLGLEATLNDICVLVLPPLRVGLVAGQQGGQLSGGR